MTVTSQDEQNPAYRPTPFSSRHRGAVLKTAPLCLGWAARR